MRAKHCVYDRLTGFLLRRASANDGRRAPVVPVLLRFAVMLSGIVVILAGGANSRATAEDRLAEKSIIRKISVAPPAEMTRADLYTWSSTADPRAVLVLCPGFNENGQSLIRQAVWQEFARANQLAICALSFASPGDETLVGRGYYYVSHGSGNVLFDGIRQAFNQDLPILIYGFSGGAHFAASLANWKPERVLSWCAYSAAWWEEPQARLGATPPGIVACGDSDAPRYGASLTFFAKGRALGRPWTWVSVGKTGHAWSGPLDNFVRAYFAMIFHHTTVSQNEHIANGTAVHGSAGTWLDVDTKRELDASQVAAQPTLASWLPDRSLVSFWTELHTP